jgi:CheY-like chemotaxis protein
MAEYVLVVEDDEEVRENLSFLLKLRGHEVQQAVQGQQALHKIHTHGPPCLVILDLMMPVMNGWEFHAAMRSDPSLDAVPVIVLSGVADAGDATKGLDAVGYLNKPCDLNKLYGLVDDHC